MCLSGWCIFVPLWPGKQLLLKALAVEGARVFLSAVAQFAVVFCSAG